MLRSILPPSPWIQPFPSSDVDAEQPKTLLIGSIGSALKSIPASSKKTSGGV